MAFNAEHGITPRSIVKQVRDLIDGVYSEKAGRMPSGWSRRPCSVPGRKTMSKRPGA